MYKKIILGLSGSIAAYKAAHLTRLFVKKGLEVRIIMTDAAQDFITPLTLSTLSKNEVLSDVSSETGWHNHVELGLWADAFIVAPATANTLAKMANGFCDNMLSAVYLSARCPVFIAPAMDLDMWAHPSTKRNISTLQADGVHLIPVGDGELASGLVGKGRMAEPEDIVAFVDAVLEKTESKTAKNFSLQGQKALVTAGPTHEALDPVRFIGNRSTGLMGIVIAEALAAAGMEVHLILGPSTLSANHPNVHTTTVQSAQQMYEACTALFADCSLAIMAAAVADYRPKSVSDVKMKKKDGELSIELERTPDIAASLGKIKRNDQLLVGFALETNNEEQNALGKVIRKNFDFIVLNSLQDKGAGFGHKTNKVTFLHADGSKKAFNLKTKKEVAQDILAEIEVTILSKKEGKEHNS